MARSTTSVRLDDELRERLSAAAAAEDTTITELIERFVREGLASAAHPGIVFKPGPSGRRASLAGGPDVWEIAAALRPVSGTETKARKRVVKGKSVLVRANLGGRIIIKKQKKQRHHKKNTQ